MNRNRIIAVTAVAAVTALGGSVLAHRGAPEGAAKRQAPIELRLAAFKKVAGHDAAGQETVDWQPLEDKSGVQSGEVVRYRITARNMGAQPVKDLVVTQPIPSGTVYVLGSATKDSGATPVFSANKGKSFADVPTIPVALANGQIEQRPAPVERYTHVRWTFTQPIAPAATVQESYDVQVR